MAGRTTPEPDDERDPDADDIDVRFTEITADLGDFTVPPDEPAEGPSRDLPEGSAPALTGRGPRDYELGPEVEVDDEDEPGFTPPEPPPLTGSDPLLTLAWSGVVVPLGLLLLYVTVWRAIPLALLGLAAAVFVLAVGVLVWRMPSRREPDDHDDGAVV